MARAATLDRIGTACKRYGPGRLPGADRPDVGAGYAGGTAALGVVTLFVLVTSLLAILGSPFGFGSSTLAVLSLYAVPVVVPVAFVAAVAVWRVLPTEIPYFGAVAGVIATLVTYVGSVVVVAALATVLAATSASDASTGTGVGFALVVGFAAFLWTFWLALPAGMVSGMVYERVGVTR